MSDRKLNPTAPRGTPRVKPREYIVNATGDWESIGIPDDAANGALHNASDVDIWISRSDAWAIHYFRTRIMDSII